jgi:hypothetical protein
MLVFMSNSTYTDSVNYHHIVGEIKNTGFQTATYVEVIATYYNSTGGVVATSYTFTNPSDVGVNIKAPFDLTLEPSRAALIDHYKLTAGANEYAVVSEYSNMMGLAAMLIPLTILVVLAQRRTRKQNII